MVELAELMVDMVPMADWAFFAKNGADATNYAVMIARAATGRKKIVAIRGGYHGTTPWMQNPGHHGSLEEDQTQILRIDWNDLAALGKRDGGEPGQIGAIHRQPVPSSDFADNEMPADGYWSSVQKFLKKNGIVFIIDDVRCGFRLHLGGSNEIVRLQARPDLLLQGDRQRLCDLGVGGH